MKYPPSTSSINTCEELMYFMKCGIFRILNMTESPINYSNYIRNPNRNHFVYYISSDKVEEDQLAETHHRLILLIVV